MIVVEQIRTHYDLEVFQLAFDAANRFFELSKDFPMEERYLLTDQIRRSSRSVAVNIAEAWRKRRYKAAFIRQFNIAEAEAAEIQVWLNFCQECNYLDSVQILVLNQTYDQIIGKIVIMIRNPDPWILKNVE